MSVKLEVYKEWRGWEKLTYITTKPQRFMNYTPNGEEIIYLEPRGHRETTVLRISSAIVESDLEKALNSAGLCTLAEISTQTLKRGQSTIIEAMPPSRKRSRLLRLTQI